MAYKLVILDFDGTLADTFPWFMRVINGVADRYRFKRIAEHEVEALRGYGARRVMRHLGVPAWKLPLIARHMRALAAQEIDAVRLFAGVDETLRTLGEAGIVIAVVSSNAEANVRHALGPRIAPLVAHYACGASLFGKAARFRHVVEVSGVRPEEALCIGDEIRDHEAAKAAGLAFGAVAWGFTRRDALEAIGPDEIFDTPAAIVERLAGAAFEAQRIATPP